jgi:glycerol kinase
VEKNYILVVDEGTTGLRAIVFDRDLKAVGQCYQKVDSFYPAPDEVEQDAQTIWEKTLYAIRTAVDEAGIDPREIAGCGITTQRSTSGFWNKQTGEFYEKMVVWQDTRGFRYRNLFLSNPQFIREHPNAAAKMNVLGGHRITVTRGVLEQYPSLKEKVFLPTTAWGFMDSWLIYKLTGGKVHATGRSFAGTCLYQSIYDEHIHDWNQDILPWMGLRRGIMPEIRGDNAGFGVMDASILGVEIPIISSVADQQAALFSEGCLEAGMAKCTMGTGTFVDLNVGEKCVYSDELNPMVAWDLGDKFNYLLEGSSPTAGACLEWAKNQLCLFDAFSQADEMAALVSDNGGIYFVPAINGMDSVPFLNATGRASFMGVSAGATKPHFVRSIMEGIAFAAGHIFEALTEQTGNKMKLITVDGGVTKSELILQTLADITGSVVSRPKLVEASGLGAAEMAALRLGWITFSDVPKFLEKDKEFVPCGDRSGVIAQYQMWCKAVERSKNWL